MTDGIVYRGLRDEGGRALVIVLAGSARRPLKHYVYHSPTGFNWGYGGSGPADLALAILANHFGARPTPNVIRSYGAARLRCIDLHQPFKRAVVSHLPREKPDG